MSDVRPSASTPAPAVAVTRRRGLLFVLSSPSGAGKTTLSRALLTDDPDIAMSVSVTTRAARAGEVDGRDYHFLEVADFERMRDSGDLLEWAPVHGNFYGTPRLPVMDRLALGSDVMFDIDWQGAQQLADKVPTDLVRVFILPPSAAILAERLRKRGLDDEAVVARRLAGASIEIDHWAEYDYVLVNDDFAETLERLKTILAAERLRCARQDGLAGFVAELQRGL